MLKKLIAWIDAYRSYRHTLVELNALSERGLRDIGLMRCDIDRVAREVYAAKLAA